MSLQKFVYENSNLNVVFENNNPLFYGKQVATILGYKDTDSAIRYHVFPEDRLEFKDFKDPEMNSGLNYHPKQILIREPGLYALIFGSKKQQAIEFKRWVFSEVLPQIHRTGSYSLNTGLLKLKDISEEDIKNMDSVQKKEFKQELKKFAELLKDPERQEKGSRGGTALWRKIKEKEELYEELQKKLAAISLIIED